MPVWTQILVRTEVPPLTILHGVCEQIHSVDADEQAEGHVAVWKNGSPASGSGRRNT